MYFSVFTVKSVYKTVLYNAGCVFENNTFNQHVIIKYIAMTIYML